MALARIFIVVAVAVLVVPGVKARANLQPIAPAGGGNEIDALLETTRGRPIRLAAGTDDAVFMRRVYLDAIGTLPAPADVRAFLADRDPGKRRHLVDQLLTRAEFADYWAMKWSDLLRVKSEFPINLWPNAVQAYHAWIRAALLDNMPYDRFARELLSASGSNFRVPQVNFYRAVRSREPAALAQAAALTFMGTRTDGWPADRLGNLAMCFSQVAYKPTGEWKEEIVFFDHNRPWTGSTAAGRREIVMPDGRIVRLDADADPRTAFATWLTSPENPWFARAIVNRVWAWLMGRGIVHEPDDLRTDNPPAHPELLSYLERRFVSSGYDLRALYRLILNSRTYQQVSLALPADDGNAFARYAVRPLEAEVLIDAISQITGTSEQYSSAIPEPFTFTPSAARSIALADGSVSSGFLETFGRSARDTGLASERSAQPTAAARLHLLNSSHIQRKLEQSPVLQDLARTPGNLASIITTLYLTILSRTPTDAEARSAAAYAQSIGTRRLAVLDLSWALINTAEFSFRH